jgi:hypothetical protein
VEEAVEAVLSGVVMTKREEIMEPTSCFNRAGITERMFVLLARDEAAPYAIREWVRKRVELGKNTDLDPQICEALQCARLMETERTASKDGH